ncbi:MAG: hypothetical protein ACYCWW_08310 [Deltaproteobacteria bacterium]
MVYLDLNHWIGLSDAAVGRSQGDNYRGALAASREARRSGRASFPLSATHYMEIAKIVDPSRRSNLAAIMEELSGFATLASRPVVTRLEIEAVLDQELGAAPSPPPIIDLVGWGVRHSVGTEGDVRIIDASGVDVTDLARAKIGAAAFDRILADARLALERCILVGPRDDAEAAKLRATGWQPDAAVKVAQERADRETELVGILDEDPRWRRGRLRDVVSARELTHEMWSAFEESLVARGISNIESFADGQRIRTFVRSMPSAEVVIEMKTARHRNPSMTWDTNTIFDIDAMALSVPYCDAVVTERHAYSILQQAGFGQRMGTALMRTPRALVDWLAGRAS